MVSGYFGNTVKSKSQYFIALLFVVNRRHANVAENILTYVVFLLN